MVKVIIDHHRSTLVEVWHVTLPRLPSFGVPAPSAVLGVPLNVSHGCGSRAKQCMWLMRFFLIVMPSFLTKGIPKTKKQGLNGQPIKVYWAIDGAAVAEWKATLHKIEEWASITWEEFAAFLRIHRVVVDGCTFANYCTFTVCEGVLLWLLAKEPNFKIPSQYSWEIVAQRRFNWGRIECNVTARAEPLKMVRTCPKLASAEKKAPAKYRCKVVDSSDANMDADVPTLTPDNHTTHREADSTNLVAPQKVGSMEVRRKNWHSLNLFRPPYVCGQCHNAVYLWSMHCEGVVFACPLWRVPP